jgi:hypothetical protein
MEKQVYEIIPSGLRANSLIKSPFLQGVNRIKTISNGKSYDDAGDFTGVGAGAVGAARRR